MTKLLTEANNSKVDFSAAPINSKYMMLDTYSTPFPTRIRGLCKVLREIKVYFAQCGLISFRLFAEKTNRRYVILIRALGNVVDNLGMQTGERTCSFVVSMGRKSVREDNRATRKLILGSYF